MMMERTECSVFFTLVNFFFEINLIYLHLVIWYLVWLWWVVVVVVWGILFFHESLFVVFCLSFFLCVCVMFIPSSFILFVCDPTTRQDKTTWRCRLKYTHTHKSKQTNKTRQPVCYQAKRTRFWIFKYYSPIGWQNIEFNWIELKCTLCMYGIFFSFFFVKQSRIQNDMA